MLTIRIRELEIKNIRGIRHIRLVPDGENMVIWGPNGSGKSAVVDAIDFLLSGNVRRLQGAGTARLSLNEHGPHIGCTKEDAWVRAEICIPGVPEPIEIRRSMARPKQLEHPAEASDKLKVVLEVASKGQHVLSRRELLRYITAEASTRAKDIQLLMNASEVENVRKALVKVANTAGKEASAAKRVLVTTIATLCATMQHRKYSAESALDVVNQHRATLGGEAIDVLSAKDLKRELEWIPASGKRSSWNSTIVQRDIANVREYLKPENLSQLDKAEAGFQELLLRVRGDQELARALEQFQLVKLGLSQLNDLEQCPLCDVAWDNRLLRNHLEQKLTKAHDAQEHNKRITVYGANLSQPISRLIASVKELKRVAEDMDMLADSKLLATWLQDLENIIAMLDDPLKKYPEGKTGAKLAFLRPPEDIAIILKRILKAVLEADHPVPPEQNAWDMLTRLEENLKALEQAEEAYDTANLCARRAAALLDTFIAERDEVFSSLYDEICGRFVTLYRKLHGVDEKEFVASMEPAGPALDLQVDFHGKGMHPPHALHSEGHQDSMGLCLYLALSEKLSLGVLDLIVLDDVVMSVDSGHRRKISTLLRSEFADKQFLITTHDKNWAGQLRTDKVVTRANSYEFINWSVDAGPLMSQSTDLWNSIKTDLEQHKVPDAAFKLRHGAEAFFTDVCDAIQAQVVYKLDGRYTLGTLMPAAISRYKRLLKKADGAARSWEDSCTIGRLEELGSVANAIIERTQAEQWAINPMVHYDRWIELSPSDFATVRDAFVDMFALFVCSSCGTRLKIEQNGYVDTSLRCDCGKVSWNLIKKSG